MSAIRIESQVSQSPIVNFINILQAAFAPKLFCQKNYNAQQLNRGKLQKALLYEKVACKMVMQLTPNHKSKILLILKSNEL